MIRQNKDGPDVIGPALLLFVFTIAFAKLGLWIALAVCVTVFLLMPYAPPDPPA